MICAFRTSAIALSSLFFGNTFAIVQHNTVSAIVYSVYSVYYTQLFYSRARALQGARSTLEVQARFGSLITVDAS